MGWNFRGCAQALGGAGWSGSDTKRSWEPHDWSGLVIGPPPKLLSGVTSPLFPQRTTGSAEARLPGCVHRPNPMAYGFFLSPVSPLEQCMYETASQPPIASRFSFSGPRACTFASSSYATESMDGVVHGAHRWNNISRLTVV